MFQNARNICHSFLLILTGSLFAISVHAQSAQRQPALIAVLKSKDASPDLFGTSFHFIENKGQYGDTVVHYGNMGKILYGYEGLGMPVLFTSKGMIFLQRKITKLSHEAEETLERKGIPEVEIEKQRVVADRTITLEWVGANLKTAVTVQEKQSAYHTYRMLDEKVYAYKKIVYTNLYPGIDLVFSFSKTAKAGFEYSLLAAPGADLSVVKLRAGGDIISLKKDMDGKLIIRSSIDGISFSIPLNYYGDALTGRAASDIPATYTITGNEIGFQFPKGYDHSKAMVLDPFVTGTGNLTGLNAGKAKDVDFDYAGDVYVTGGGDMTATHSLAKFNSAGALQWTFNGSLTIPSWTFGSYFGGWMVEKSTGNVYMGQGFDPATGFKVIRVTSQGLYDNFITTPNPSFMEAWKMFWNCNNGSPQILIAGGGINSSTNFGVFAPPSTTVSSLNITGIPYAGSTGWAQDIVDFVFDPANNDMYTVFGSLFGTPSLNNKMYKNTAPYSSASVVWNVPTGYNTVSEAANRPYLTASGLNDNSANMLSVNASWLYFWDGKNLKAFDKSTGGGVGTALTTANTPFMQGGIIADACNNVFVGEANGLIKVYQFNGSTFSDAPADIPIPGFAGKAVYDLAYDESRKLLYASGDGFVASFDVAAYCPSTLYTINVVPDCLTASATATITPAPPAGSIITYTLTAGGNVISTNTTGIFSGLLPNITYNILATINQACSGAQATATFILPGPVVTATAANTTCGNSTGTITATGSGTTGPYTYSIDGTNFQASGNFTGLAAGIYTVTVKDGSGCITRKILTVLNSNGPQVSFTSANAQCGNNNGSVTASVTGGTPPYQYSINNGVTYQSSNFFTGLGGGTFTLTVKDATGCTNAVQVSLTSSPAPQITATPAAATCGNNNGSITAYGASGTPPLQYSINGNTFQASSQFINLAPGNYTVTVKDANGCTGTVTVTIPNSPAPAVTAVSTPAACNNVNGTITATGAGGIAPLQYSINGSFFQVSNIFTGLGAGTYTVTVKDVTGCSGITTVTVTNTNAPVATATSTVSACNVNNGSISIFGSGGVTPYQYSINGSVFQAGNTFTGLAPGNCIAYIRDAGGCIATFSILVGTTAGPSITAAATQTACNTNTGTITANGTGGTPPLQYSIDGTTYQAGNSFTGLPAATYTVYVKDANGCIKTTAVTVTNVSGLTLSASSIASDCSGSTGSITATAAGGTAPLQYSINGTVYQAGNVFSGVPSGIYTVYVKDATGCIVTKQVTVIAATGPSISLSVTMPPSCGAANGVIRATGTGGTMPLTYSLDGGAYQPIFFFTGVLPGLHNVTVKDANGCTAAASITLTNTGSGTAPTDVTFTVKDALACTGLTGRIKNLKGVPGGGGNTYVFSLDGGPFTTANQFTNVSVGVHTITAQNQTGCTISKIVTVGSGNPATATATATATACSASTGTITIVGVGANKPYHASIDNGATWVTFFPPGANTFTFTGLASGTYPIIIADDADFVAGPPDIPGACLTTIYVAVPSTGGPSISTTQINPTCTSPNGSITASGSGGTAPYTYSINGGPYFASGTFNNLAPGIYAVLVKDATGCITGVNVTLSSPSIPSATAVVQSTSCNDNNGSITATGTGGVAPLEYSLNGTVFQSSNVFSNLAPGTYTLYVKDANNCYSSTVATVASTPLPFVSAFTIAATCNNNDGSVVAAGTGGTAPYTFSVNGAVYQSSVTFSGLAAGFYTVYMKDARGCIVTTGVTVENVTAPAVTNTSTQSATCNNANGSITVTAAGGSAPLEYSINSGTFQPGNIFSALLPGTYTVTVRDANGCLANRPVVVANINGPQGLTAVIVDAACGNANGAVTATASGGTAPLQYSLNGTAYQAGAVFTNIIAGSYTLYVKDANSCIISIPVTVANLAAAVLTATSSPASCGLSDGTITAVANGGTQPLTYSINGTVFQNNNVFTGLPSGPYTVTVKDARNCTATFTLNVGVIGSVVVPTFTQAGPYCTGAVIPALPVISNNGITGTWSPAINNTVTTLYTFTPAAGQCANTTTMTITINPKPTPIIIYHN